MITKDTKAIWKIQVMLLKQKEVEKIKSLHC